MQQTFESMNALVAEGERLKAEREPAQSVEKLPAESQQVNRDFFGVIDEDAALGRNHQQRFLMLEAAMENIGLAEHVAKWKIARLIHLVAGTHEGKVNDGVLCRSAADIAKDKDVKCSYKTALRSIQWLIDSGLVEVVREEVPACQGGRPYRCLCINWQFVARNQHAEQLDTELDTQQDIELDTQQDIELDKQLDISNSLYSSLSPTPPPPLSPTVAAAVVLLRTVLSDEDTIQQLAADHTDRVSRVVAEYELNREHLGPGAVSYRLKSPIDAWPTDKATKTLESEARQAAFRDAQRRESAAKDALEADQKRKDAKIAELRTRHGPVIDAMSDREFVSFGLKHLPEEDHESFRQFPRVFEPEILEAMEMSCKV